MRIPRNLVDNFAATTGDRSPVHVDAGHARRTPFGEPIAHGALVILALIARTRSGRPFRAVDARFPAPVFPDRDYTVSVDSRAEETSVLLHDGGRPLVDLRLAHREPAGEPCLDTASGSSPAGPVARWPRAAARRMDGDALSAGERLVADYGPDLPGLGALLDALGDAERATAGLAVPLAVASYVVGMEAPGSLALLTRLRVELPDLSGAWSEGIRVDVRAGGYDPQFQRLTIEGTVTDGHRTAVLRAESAVRTPAPPADPGRVRERVDPDAFAGRVAVVTGGSRGLGAALVQALALGGAQVYALYRDSAQEADRTRASLATAADRVHLVQGDCADAAVLAGLRERILREHGRLDILVLNAAPALGELALHPATTARATGYVRDSLALAQTPLAAFTEEVTAGATVVGISSAVITDPVPLWAHYGAAKAALEATLAATARVTREGHFLVVRPPRLRTDLVPAPVAGEPRRAEDVAAAIAERLGEGVAAGEVTVLDTFPAPEQPPTEAETPAAIAVSATFTAEPLAPSLTFWSDHLGLEVEPAFAPYAQTVQQLLDPASLLSRNRRGVDVLLVRFADWAGHVRERTQELIESVDVFRGRAHVPLLVVLCPDPPSTTGDPDRDAAAATLADGIEAMAGVYLVVAGDSPYTAAEPGVLHDPDRDELAQIPYTDAGFAAVGTLVMRAAHALLRPPAKVLVLDCDNTLWSGVCAEDGAEGVRITAEHRAFQQRVLALKATGVLVALVSKNEPEDVFAVLRRPDSPLRAEHLAAYRINWQNKSENLRELAAELNVALDSFVFLDDNPVEVAEVRSAVPDVLALVCETGGGCLDHVWSLDRLTVTDEDRRRTEYYRAARERTELRGSARTFADYIEGLAVQVELSESTSDDLPRLAQMTQRTNQMNTTTIRRQVADITAAVGAGMRFWAIRVTDRFGDYGLVGLAATRVAPHALVVDSLLLSCRVLGRGGTPGGGRAGRCGLGGWGHRPGSTVRGHGPQQPGPAVPRRRRRSRSAGRRRCAHLPRTGRGRAEPAVPTAGRDRRHRGRRGRDPRAGVQRPDRAGPARRDRRASVHSGRDRPRGTGACHRIGRRGGAGRSSLVDEVQAIFAETLGVPRSRLGQTVTFDALGLSSFSIVDLTVALRRRFEGVPATLLFEHRTIASLASQLAPPSPAGPVPAAAPAPAADLRPPARTERPAPPPADGDVAVVGLAGRYPGAADLDELWANLAAGTDAITDVPGERWDHHRHLATGDGPVAADRTYSRWLAALDGVDRFDSLLFRISPAEAEMMDPQQRLFLQTAYAAIEDAGYRPDTLSRTAGVYVGAMANDYGVLAAQAAIDGTSPYPYAERYQIANRVSYAFDLTGPSLTIDTACSSSAVALHLACEDLRRGAVDAAIAGGVNLVLHPARHIQYAQMGMLSRHGRCRTFGAGGDGFVMGEGVGAVLLKPLRAALAAGDHIHAVIKGTATNSGGRTTGFTVPSPDAQAELIRRALAAAGVAPDTISYVEAHGTGTALGDPIEIRGLSSAFGALPARSCAVGSVKPNIGHLEPAAGIAGLTKVILQLRHRQLAPLPDHTDDNPDINFAATPFYPVTALSPWHGHPGAGSDPAPLRAGISSFGAGGVNAHIVAEQAPARVMPPDGGGPELIVLSARDPQRLQAHADALHRHLTSAGSGVRRADVAYTLRVGREPMAHRVAFVCAGRDELLAGLRSVAEAGTEAPVAVAAGRVDTGAALADIFDGVEHILPMLAAENRWDRLARLWVAGARIPWEAIPGSTGRRVPLPPYPFAPVRHWLPTPAGPPAPATADPAWHADEPFIRDHVVGGTPIMPGVGFLEIAHRVAGIDDVSRVQGAVWSHPLPAVGAEPVDVRVDAGDVRFVGRHTGTEYARCRLSVAPLATPRAPAGSIPDGAVRLTADRVYERLAALGLAYGPALRSIRDVATWPGAAEARLTLPDAGAPAHYRLHPAILDGTLQTVLLGAGAGATYLPYALGELRRHGDPAGTETVRVRLIHRDERTIRADAVLLDPAGRVLVELADIALRRPDLPAAGQEPPVTLYEFRWTPEPAPVRTLGDGPVVLIDDTVRTDDDVRALVSGQARGGAVTVLDRREVTGGDATDRAMRHLAAPVAGARAALAPDGPRITWIAVTRPEAVDPAAAVASGLGAALAWETERFRLVRVEVGDTVPATEALLAEAGGAEREVSWVGGERKVRRPIPIPAGAARRPYRTGGTYVISGGAGGLGVLLARHLSSRYSAKVALLGRAPASARTEDLAREVTALGGEAAYLSVDVTDRAGLEAALTALRSRWGPIHGVFHAAGILADGLLAGRDLDTFRPVLLPKIAGAETLDAATRDDPLDLFLLMSSVSGRLGAAGQTGYAAANRFLDAFAQWRDNQVAAGTRRGRTVSVAWPLWQDGGMRPPEASIRQTRDQLGLVPLASGPGLAVVDRCLDGDLAPSIGTVLVATGDSALVARVLGEGRPATAIPVTRPRPSAAEVEAILVDLSADLLRVPAAELDVDAELADHGFDSVLLARFADRVNDALGIAITPVVFFDHPSLRATARELIRRHGSELEPARSDDDPAGTTPPAEREPTSEPARDRQPLAAEPIAVIGMSGRFPGSPDLDAFWQNLAAGRDLVTRLPADRWPGEESRPWGGFLHDVDAFDAEFFKVSPKQAMLMDPQQRLFLEECWHAIENAGYDPTALAGSRTGVFAGVTLHDHLEDVLAAGLEPTGQMATGNVHAVVANQVSYQLDLRGPSESVDTACSSSLVALHRAVGALRAGECTTALVGGVNVVQSPTWFTAFAHAGMLSPEGRCRTFDRAADGYVRGEGVGVVMLKPLGNALRDGDRIDGLIRGTAVGHSGRGHSLTAPSAAAQAEVIAAAYRAAGVSTDSVSYVETHGTGTVLGDPIEVAGLRMAFGDKRRDPCYLGAVKTQIGHLESASGVAGLIKILLAMRHGHLPGNLHLREPNPHLELHKGPFEALREGRDWPATAHGRRAGLSSIGFGGTSAHVVVEQHEGPPGRPARPAYPFARTRHIVPRRAPAPDTTPGAAPTVLLVPHWRPAPLPPATALAGRSAAVLVVGAGQTLDVLCDLPTVTDLDWIVLRQRSSLPSIGAHDREADLDDPDDCARALREVLAERPDATALVDIVDADPAAAGGRGRVGLLRAFLAATTGPVSAVHVAVEHTDPARAAAAAHLAAYYRTAAAEYGRFRATTAEVTDHRVAHGLRVAVDELRGGCADARTRYRPDREVMDLRPAGDATARRQPDTALGPYPIDPDRPYLITGGTGGLGLAVAGRLVHRGARMLALLGERPVPARREWDSLPAAHERRGLADAIRRLEAAGARVELHSGALTDEHAVSAFLDRLRSVHGPVAGVVHCAGRPASGEPAFVKKPLTEADRTRLPKLDGLVTIDRLLAQDRCDFMVLFSSVSATVPGLGVGMADYAAANAGLDAFATAAGGRRDHTAYHAIAWGSWAEVGMGAVDGARYGGYGLSALSTSDGLELLDRALALPSRWSLAAATDPAVFRPDLLTQPAVRPTEPAVEATDRPEIQAATTRFLTELLASELMVAPERLTAGTRLADLGVDSVFIAGLVPRLETFAGRAIGPSVVIEHPSVGELAAHLATIAAPDIVTAPPAPAPDLPPATVTPARRPVPMAVIGMAGRYPGAPDLEAFWDLLVAGRCAVSPVPADRPRPAPHPDRRAGFLAGIDKFDPGYFGIADEDAAHVDPVTRVFLETVAQTVADAGYEAAELAGRRVGVFVGGATSSYGWGSRPAPAPPRASTRTSSRRTRRSCTTCAGPTSSSTPPAPRR
ncbi:SDR family NAD(P)-dependent oxidoreductase [Phytohabitans flavus]|uniref:SDR family NAD(P)-dependent oxidoreductase n=1 Tax=Phytohabitans flavus TaxID=1076124 RepID=UPI00362DCA0D